MKLITDEIDKFIRVILRDQSEFKPNSVSYFQIDFNKGIYAAVGELNASQNDRAIHSFLFEKDKNDVEKVKKFMKSKKGFVWTQEELHFKKSRSIDEKNLFGKEGKMAYRINDVPIFKVGIHNDHKYSQKDLKEMVDNYHEMKTENPDFQIPIKLGHDAPTEPEKMAVGWMENLRISGEYIIADFVDLVEEAYTAIKNKTFKNRSIEFFINFVNSKGEKLGKLIKGIALLGGSLPAVNLPDIKFIAIPQSVFAFAEGKEFETVNYESLDDDMEFENESELDEKLNLIKEKIQNLHSELSKKEDKKMGDTIETIEKKESVEKKEDLGKIEEIVALSIDENATGDTDEFKKLIDDMVGDPEKFISAYKEMKKKTAEAEKLTAEFHDREKREHQTEIHAFTKGLIAKNKIIPADAYLVEEILSNCDRKNQIEFKYSELEITKTDTLYNMLVQFMGSLPDRGLLRQESEVAAYGSPEEKFHRYLKGLGKDYEKLSAKDLKTLMIDYKKINPEFMSFSDSE